MRALLPLLILAAHAAPQAPTADQVAGQAVAAVESDESAALRALAERDDPDPWLVVAALCARQRYDAAEAFARAAPRADVAKLPEQIAVWKKAPPAWGEDDGGAADAETLYDAHRLAARAKLSGSAADYETAALRAAKIGWLSLAAQCRQEQILVLERARDYGAAVAAANAWLAIETGRGPRAQLAAALTTAGRLSLAAERLPEAEDLLRRALRQSERSEDPLAVARSEALLGRVLLRRGATQDARVYLRRAREALEDQPDELLFVLFHLITLDKTLDGVDKGLARAEEMLALARKQKNPEQEAFALASMASMQLERKDYTAASHRFAQAEEAFRRAKQNVFAGRMAFERGDLALRTGRLGEAEQALNAALALTGADGPKRIRARIHAAIGEWAVETGREEAAEKHLGAAAKLAVEIEDSALAARTLARRGRLALRRGEWDAARKVLTQALAEERKANAEADVARTLLDLAVIDIAQDKKEQAQARATEAIALARRTKVAATLARGVALDAQTRLGDEKAGQIVDRVRAGARESLALLEAQRAPSNARFEAALTLLLRVGTDAAIAANDVGTLLAAGEYGRSRLMLHALGGRTSLMKVLTPLELAGEIEKTRAEEEEAIAEYQRQRERMARDAMLKAKKAVASLQAKRKALEEKRLASLESARWLLGPGVPASEAIEAALAPSETLVYYCVGTKQVAAVIMTSGGATIRPLGELADIEAAVAAVRTALDTEDPYPALKRFQASHVSRLGLAPGRELVIAGAEPLDDVPFAAVTPEQTVRYVASAADLIRQAAEGKKAGSGVLGVGNPEFGDGELQLRLVHLRNGIPLRRLESARTLAQEIGDAVLVGQRATESEFRSLLRTRERWKAIHFAVPGLLDSSRPYLGSLALAPDGKEDGLLTTYDLIQLRLPADLSVLAACEPAKGTVDVTPAVAGMTQAVQLAGSARVIISQWFVDDKAASALMKQFYHYYANGQTAAPLALRRAQKNVSSMHGWVHPKAWAGWQLWGAR
ncbi:MAG: CHAT domain-containing protein [Planctomycetota bacterium]|jgi:tetratricopeptide (TPR) repeat protein